VIPIIDLLRIENSFGGGVLGVLRICNKAFCATLEPAEQDNAPNYSCIPAIQYVCGRVNSSRFGETFEVLYVPNRTHILFHKGNTSDDTTGCIILGSTWGKLSGNRKVINSGKTFNRFMDVMLDYHEFIFTIKEVY